MTASMTCASMGTGLSHRTVVMVGAGRSPRPHL
jgi:hypothetical protein